MEDFSLFRNKVNKLTHKIVEPLRKYTMIHTSNSCELVQLISKYYDVLIHTLSIELSNYYVIDTTNTTKCLNTSIIIIYLLFRMQGVRRMKYCDTTNTRERIERGIENFDKSIRKFEKQLFSKRKMVPKSLFFYVMLTDSHEFTYPIPLSTSKQGPYFPGHTFLIEKHPNNKFTIYQSYINEFDLHTFMTTNGCLIFTEDQIKDMVATLAYICDHDRGHEWDINVNEQWKRLTGVDGTKFMGVKMKGVHFCYKRFTTNQAIKNINSSLTHLIRNQSVQDKLDPDIRRRLQELKGKIEYYMKLQ